MGLRLTAWSCALVAACYAPRPQPGSPCGAGGACPTGLVCSPATGTCELSTSDVDAGAPGDGNHDDPDAKPGDAGSSLCFGTGLVSICLAQPPTGVVMLSGMIDTDTSTMCAALSPDQPLCAIASEDLGIAMGETVTAVGSRPLVLVASNGIAVRGTLDAASHRLTTTGPAADAASCSPGTAPTSPGGGQGGSFGTTGGAGGNNTGGLAGAPQVPTALRGGCPGAAGAGLGSGGGGRGGGAVYLIAGTAISVSGAINASGAGGKGAASTAGGGGGGSGGMIGLDAATIGVSGEVFANGGGGGEGAGLVTFGQPGDDPSGAMNMAAGGAGGSGTGGDGGAGGRGLQAGVAGQGASGGGGGGGGGVGVIKVYGTLTGSGVISPPPS